MPQEDIPSEPVTTGSSTVEIRTAASPSLIPTVRAVASDLAARADFDLDAISDLRMAVDEACATLVGLATAGSALLCTFDVHGERIDVSAEVHTAAGATLPTDSFGWRVLQTLADQVSIETPETTDGSTALRIRLHKLAGPAL
ncbi:serine/threonine-protein kinase RsbW [Pseudonocardia sediminis]|uniref:Serine/threonine-protein kinase RsbW n=1 Tax=Pseudonocardia sediminis TaxID=1397368 RepID=A0A4Q7UW21_PSEST|nr:ATP-binding protein [Pseudonocardia sediminis]RZT84343.1 serine/threonine-protein kinase RsbW [Pseudonocardia sediminis]